MCKEGHEGRIQAPLGSSSATHWLGTFAESLLAMLHHDLLFCIFAIVLAEPSLLSSSRAGTWLSLLAYLLCRWGVVDGVE